MLLRVKERLLLLNILPQQGTAITLRIVAKQQEALSFSEEEIKVLGFTYTGDKVEWKDEFDKLVDILIGEVATGLIVEALKSLDARQQLKPEFLPLYEHFVEGEDWPLNKPSEAIPPPELLRDPEPRTTKEVLGARPAAEGSKD